MSLLRPSCIHTSRLHWHPEHRLFTADASDLPVPSRAFNDACDLGYTLISERTGRQIVVVQNGDRRDGEGELEYVIYDEADHRGPKRSPLVRLHVYND
jgi:hypothetical protein